MNKLSIAFTTVAVVASVTVCLAIQHGAGARLRKQNETLGLRAEQLMELSAQNENLSNLVLQVKNSDALSKEQLTELLRLRSEVAQLRDNGPVKAQLEQTNAQLRAVEAKAQRQLAEAETAPNYWPKEQLAYAGYADPASCVRSMLTAMRDGDLRSWRQSCTPEANADLEKEWKAHGISPDREEAEIKAMADMLISPSSGFHILEQKMTSPYEAVVNLSFDGEGTARRFVLRKIGEEWKLHDMLAAGQDEPAR